MPQPAAEATSVRPHGERFIINVLWSWTGVAASLFQGFVITPFIIRRLGEEHYGIWLIIFSILEYFWFFDLGLNTAVCVFCARYIAVKDHEKINQVISTALFYFAMIAVVIWTISPVLAANAYRFLRVTPAYRQEFATLILLTGISWGLCVMLHLFLSALDGFQRFDLTSHVMVLQVALRSAGYFLALKFGYGLVAMAEVFVATQILGYVLNFLNFRRAFPELRLSPAFVSRATFQEILQYGLKSFVAGLSTLALNQSGTLMVTHYLGAAAAGFYGLPSRLLQQPVDAVSRVANVTRSKSAELSVTDKREATIALGIYTNRYSLTLFMVPAVFLLVYGYPLLLRWVGPVMASQSGPVMPIFLLAYSLVLAAQYNSSSLLYGVGHHGGYARGLVVEAVLYVAALALVVPRFGIVGAAWATAGMMIAVRGIYTPWLVARALDYSWFQYMAGIYARPLLAAVPAVALAWGLKSSVLPGKTWPELVAAGCISGFVYAAVAFFACVAAHHRELILARIPVVGPRLIPRRA
jgi:O-antigen/teichoic acid export membrane protein